MMPFKESHQGPRTFPLGRIRLQKVRTKGWLKGDTAIFEGRHRLPDHHNELEWVEATTDGRPSTGPI